MSEQERNGTEQAGMQPRGGGEPQQGSPGTVPSEEVGRGPGLDPPSPSEDEDEGASGDEAFADRPSRPAQPATETTEGGSVTRPPADS